MQYTIVPSDSSMTVQKVSETVQKASEFFWRADFTDLLNKIWDSIKRLPLATLLKMVMVVALIAALVLLSHSLSLSGLLALGASLGGLLFAAVSNVFVWLIYVPMCVVKTSDFATSILLAVGLAWLGGVTPIAALALSPAIIFGFRWLERSPLTQQSLSEIADEIVQRKRQLVAQLNKLFPSYPLGQGSPA